MFEAEKSSVRVGRLLAPAVVLFLLCAPGYAAARQSAWTIKGAGGNAFTGTYTNDTGSPVHAVGISTAEKSANPITSFTFDGEACQAGGVSYCPAMNGGSSPAPIAPGATVTFKGTTAKAVTVGETFVACLYEQKTTCENVTVGGGTKSEDTVNFVASQTSHEVVSHSGVFLLTTTKGLGKLVVPPPAADQSVSSKSATGSIKFSVLKFSPKSVLILDEDNVVLFVKSGLYDPSSSANTVHLSVVVVKSTVPKGCPVGAPGTVILFDGSPANKEPDEVSISLPRCHVDEQFANGNAKTKASVAVAIRLEGNATA